MSRYKVPDNQVVNVKPLPEDFTDDDLAYLFKTYCKSRDLKFSVIHSLKVIKGGESNTVVGFINCTSADAANKIVACLDGVTVDDVLLKADLKSNYLKFKEQQQASYNEYKARKSDAAAAAAVAAAASSSISTPAPSPVASIKSKLAPPPSSHASNGKPASAASSTPASVPPTPSPPSAVLAALSKISVAPISKKKTKKEKKREKEKEIEREKEKEQKVETQTKHNGHSASPSPAASPSLSPIIGTPIEVPSYSSASPPLPTLPEPWQVPEASLSSQRMSLSIPTPSFASLEAISSPSSSAIGPSPLLSYGSGSPFGPSPFLSGLHSSVPSSPSSVHSLSPSASSSPSPFSTFPLPYSSSSIFSYPLQSFSSSAPFTRAPVPPGFQPWSPFQQPPLPPAGPLRFDTIAHEVCVSVDGAPLFSLAPLMQIAPTPEKNIGYCDVPLGSAMKPYSVSLILRYAHELKGHVMEVQMHVPPTAGSAGSGNNKQQQQGAAAEIISFGTGYFSESTGTSKLSHIVNPLLGRSQQSATLVFTLKQQSMMM